MEPQAVPFKEPTHGLTYSDSLPLTSSSLQFIFSGHPLILTLQVQMTENFYVKLIVGKFRNFQSTW